ncbi:MAG: hypothetical protein IPP14_04080 [Planctomycetes bacterium]|nr:hypothetical protein [Planctomycetota bacterium]
MKQGLLILGLCIAALAAACRHVPNDTVKGKGSAGEERARLLQEAEAAWEKQPRSLESVQESVTKFGKALEQKADEYETLWHAARSCSWLGEFMESREARRPIIKDGIRYTNTALKLKPEGIEGRFYHGVLAGMLGDVDHDYGLNAAKTVDEDMRKLADAGADVGNAGPWRVLGVLQMRAPGPPTSVGSLRNAHKNLLAAVEKAPQWPENQLYCAEMEFAWAKEKDQPESAQSARDRLQQHLLGPEAKAPQGFSFEFARWQQTARELLKANP